jgi:hypothetical protein
MNFLKNIFKGGEQPVRSYADFWTWFQKNEKAFFKVVKEKRDIHKDFFDKLSPKLNELKDGFYFLTGIFDEHTVELVLTADGAVKNIPFVEELVKAAPQINGWKFTALKPALDITNVYIKMGGYKFADENIHFYANNSNEFPDEIDITVLHDDLTQKNKDTIINGIYIFLDNFIGELNFATTIDNVKVIGKSEAEKELVPIAKLKDFLKWREKEFIEKYEGVRHNTENDTYSGLEATLNSGNPVVAIINTDLLNWDSKASHPWIMSVEIKYVGTANNGMPDNKTYQLLDDIEKDILRELKDFDGYLNIGRQTAENTRDIYFACRDFRKPSIVAYSIVQKYSGQVDITYDVYKDKYWQSFERFR